jgi:hypothetical protein
METYNTFEKNYQRKYNAYLKAYGKYKMYCYDTLFKLLSKLEDRTMYLYHNDVRLFEYTILVSGEMVKIDTIKIRHDSDNTDDIILYAKDGRWWSFYMLSTFEYGELMRVAYDYVAAMKKLKSR